MSKPNLRMPSVVSDTEVTHKSYTHIYNLLATYSSV